MEWTGRRGGRRREQLLDNLQEREGTGNCNRKHHIALSGELSLERATYLA
jgi:hypothetical protein